MPQTYYLRPTQISTGYTEKSTDTANKTASDAGNLLSLLGTKGAAVALPASITNTTTSAEYWFHRAYATPELAAQTINAGTWSVRMAPQESTGNLTHFARYFCYVLRAGANVATIFGPV